MKGVLWVLLLLAADFSSADGYLFELRKDGYKPENLLGCVSNEKAVAFANRNIKTYFNKNDFRREVTQVDILDLDGRAVPLIEYDCNLVKADGCKYWDYGNAWEKKFNFENNFDPFPMVTDSRWNDLPVKFTNGTFEEKIAVKSNTNFRLHFSVLAHNSAQFLFTNNSDSRNGFNVAIDGWGPIHKSVLRFCYDIPEKDYPKCNGLYKTHREVLHAGEKWAHGTFQITNSDNEETKDELLLNDTIHIHWFKSTWFPEVSQHVSFKTNMEGIFKLHQYSVLQSKEREVSMELQIKEDSTNFFCVDVVLLSNSSAWENEVISVKVLDENEETRFNAPFLADKRNEWLTAKFRSSELTPKRGWKIILTAHVEALVIGGISFCKEGDVVIKPKRIMTNCSSLGNSNIGHAGQEFSHLKNLLARDLSGCNIFESGCSGVKACTQSGNCSCFPGFGGVGCTGCQRMGYGLNCVNISTKDCIGEKINHVNGNCLEGCKGHYIFPECEKECMGPFYGSNCSETYSRHCFNDEFYRSNGTCRDGCEEGFKFPDCNKAIQRAKPIWKSITANEIILCISSSLAGKQNIGQVKIEYKKRSEHEWEAETYLVSQADAANAIKSIKNLKPNTVYDIRFALIENGDEFEIKNHLFGEVVTFKTKCKLPIVDDFQLSGWSVILTDNKSKEELCGPKKLSLLVREGRSMSWEKSVDESDFEIDFSDADNEVKCGINYTVSLEVQDDETPLEYNYVKPCPPPGSSNAVAVTLVTLLILALLVALCVFLCFKKRRGKGHQGGRVAFVNDMVIINTGMPPSAAGNAEENIYELPLIDHSSEVERYLLAALTGNFLKDQYEKLERGQTQPWDAGTKPENRKKNRYGNLAAYDSSRVKLELLPGDPNSDYINANYIDGYKRSKAYIASQGPKANTINDFWRMVWQEKISLIVMVTNLQEGGKNKCEKYWPDEAQEARYGRVAVRTVREEINADFISRVLSVSRDNTNRLVQQLHYTNWPDHGVPLYAQSMAIFIEKIAQHNDQRPILVHCSAGVGRTGTVILIDACLRMYRSCNRIDVVSIFSKMRSQRVNLVDNLKQYEFAHLVLMESIVNPKFDVSCAIFTEECMMLMANNKKKLKENFEKLSALCQRDFNRAELPVKNETDKCRYPDLIASSNAIVRLFPYGNVVTMSFINAVFVDGYKRAKEFITTQVPMQSTIADFWRMIDQYNVKEIVVLNEPHISEGIFLPTKQGTFVFGDIKVVFDAFQEEEYFKTLEFVINSKGKCKKVNVKCFYGWKPREEAPPNLHAVFELWGSLKISGEKESVTVVCHDGATASGLFLGIGFVIEKIKLEQKVDVGLAVRTLRKSRPAFISTEFQFTLLYKAASMYLDAFDTYGNFK